MIKKPILILLLCLGISTPLYSQSKSDTTGISNPEFIGYPSISTKDISDTTNIFKPTLNGYTFAYYTPETQFAFGAGGIVTFYMAKQAAFWFSHKNISHAEATWILIKNTK